MICRWVGKGREGGLLVDDCGRPGKKRQPPLDHRAETQDGGPEPVGSPCVGRLLQWNTPNEAVTLASQPALPKLGSALRQKAGMEGLSAIPPEPGASSGEQGLGPGEAGTAPDSRSPETPCGGPWVRRGWRAGRVVAADPAAWGWGGVQTLSCPPDLPTLSWACSTGHTQLTRATPGENRDGRGHTAPRATATAPPRDSLKTPSAVLRLAASARSLHAKYGAKQPPLSR